MTKLQLLFVFISISLVIISADEYGDGDLSVYPHWIYGNQYCYDFIDTEPYQLARVHVDYDSTSGEFGFLENLNIEKCVTVASYVDKNLLIHLYVVPTPEDLLKFATFLGEEFTAAWLHYDLFANWTGDVYVAPFETVVLSLAKENSIRDKYTEEDLRILMERIHMVKGTNVKKAVQLNANMVKKSKELDWKKLVTLYDYTLVYNDDKKGQKKEEMLQILKSPIPFTIWDTAVLKTYGRESEFKDVNFNSQMFGPE